MSHAPGLFGIPDCGHCSSAATSASCARSSATPMSRTMRVRPAMSRGASMRQTASIARWVSAAVTATDHTIVRSHPQAFRGLLLPRVLIGELTSHVLRGAAWPLFGLREDLPHLALATAGDREEVLGDLDGFRLRAPLEDGEP